MRVGIDYRFAVRTNRGIGIYIRELVHELMRIDQINEYILYSDEDVAINLPENFSKRILPFKNIILFEQVYLPIQGRRDRLDVLWYPSNSGPVILHKSIKLVVTVHDVISFMNHNKPYRISFKAIKYRTGEYYRRITLRKGLARIDELVTVSEFSRSEIRRILNRNAHVIANNINPSTNHLEPDLQILETLGLKANEYFFTMTGDAPHKNLRGLLDCFSDLTTDKKLVIGGAKNSDIIVTYPVQLKERVIFTGFVTETEKAALYQNCYAFLFLSLYEGFGIPLLEAMQHHVPVVASNRASMPEIIGNGGLLVDPLNTEEIVNALRSLPDYDKRKFERFQDEQLQRFSSWANSALKLHDIFINLSNLKKEELSVL